MPGTLEYEEARGEADWGDDDERVLALLSVLHRRGGMPLVAGTDDQGAQAGDHGDASQHPETGGRGWPPRTTRDQIMSIRLHTPGPWTIDYTDDNLRIYAGDLLIAEVNGSTERIEVRGLDAETTEANTWLIAAAPDLLAALERILARVETFNLFTEHGDNAKVVEQARAAIGKARGQGYD